jgi:hypothetical protein
VWTLARSAVAALVALIVVGGVIALFNLGGGHKKSPGSTALVSTSSTPPPPSVTLSSVSAAPPTTAPPATSKAPITKPAVPKPPAATHPAPAPGFRGPVNVYNGSSAPTATSHAVAALQTAGYAVVRVRVVRYYVSRTTVYYDSGFATEAATMVNLHIGVLAAAPRPRSIASTGTLIVVVARGYVP